MEKAVMECYEPSIHCRDAGTSTPVLHGLHGREHVVAIILSIRTQTHFPLSFWRDHTLSTRNQFKPALGLREDRSAGAGDVAREGVEVLAESD